MADRLPKPIKSCWENAHPRAWPRILLYILFSMLCGNPMTGSVNLSSVDRIEASGSAVDQPTVTVSQVARERARNSR